MVDTTRTKAFLLNNIFQDGQAPGSVTTQDMRDMIVSIYDAYRITLVDTLDLESSNNDTIKFISPIAGTIESIQIRTDSAVTGADGTVTGDIGGTGITNGVVTVALIGAAIDKVYSIIPTALNILAIDDVITLTVGGANTTVGLGSVTILIKPTIA